MRPLAEVQRHVLGAVPLLEVVDVDVEGANGLVLAGEVTAPHDVPSFDNSAMDGYAVRAADTGKTPAVLDVIQDVAAGHLPTRRVEAGTAIKIMTGAPIPAGADAVVKVEDTVQEGARVQIMQAVPVGENIRPAGSDLRSGSTVFGAGTRLTPHHLGVLTSIGVSRPSVRRRPVVAVLSTGDEVVSPGDRLAAGKIHDSNRPQLMAMLAELGAETIDLGIVGDDAEALRHALQRGADAGDVVVTSGGVSMGEYDLVKAIVRDAGDVEVWKVAMKPAKPFAFGRIHGTPFFGLPGNPVSVVVAFEQFVRPALLKMMGAGVLFRPRISGILSDDVTTDPEKTVFLRARAIFDGRSWLVHPESGQSSHQLTALARADAFAVVPAGVAGIPAGDVVELEMFRWPESRTEEEVLGAG